MSSEASRLRGDRRRRVVWPGSVKPSRLPGGLRVCSRQILGAVTRTVGGPPRGSYFTALESLVVALIIVVGTALVIILAADPRMTEFMMRCCHAPMRVLE